MMIRKADAQDVLAVARIYDDARLLMRERGIPQWQDGCPGLAEAEVDQELGKLYVCENAGDIVGSFTFAEGPDITYGIIEDGSWLSDEPYWVVHRFAASRPGAGVGHKMLEWAYADHDNVRIDTHELNIPMRRLLDRHGFILCGVIHLLNGAPRFAYQRRAASLEPEFPAA